MCGRRSGRGDMTIPHLRLFRCHRLKAGRLAGRPSWAVLGGVGLVVSGDTHDFNGERGGRKRGRGNGRHVHECMSTLALLRAAAGPSQMCSAGGERRARKQPQYGAAF